MYSRDIAKAMRNLKPTETIITKKDGKQYRYWEEENAGIKEIRISNLIDNIILIFNTKYTGNIKLMESG